MLSLLWPLRYPHASLSVVESSTRDVFVRVNAIAHILQSIGQDGVCTAMTQEMSSVG